MVVVPEPRPTTRMCIGCRGKQASTGLLRFVSERVDHRDLLRFDASGHAMGRGAWLHPEPRCWTNAVKRKAFARALRAPDLVIPPETEAAVRGSTMKADE